MSLKSQAKAGSFLISKPLSRNKIKQHTAVWIELFGHTYLSHTNSIHLLCNDFYRDSKLAEGNDPMLVVTPRKFFWIWFKSLAFFFRLAFSWILRESCSKTRLWLLLSRSVYQHLYVRSLDIMWYITMSCCIQLAYIFQR